MDLWTITREQLSAHGKAEFVSDGTDCRASPTGMWSGWPDMY